MATPLFSIGDRVYSRSMNNIGEIISYYYSCSAGAPNSDVTYDVSFEYEGFEDMDGTGQILYIVPRTKIESLPQSDLTYVDEKTETMQNSLNRKTKVSCEHTWQDYQGLMEAYRFCTKCNQKEKP